MKRCILMLCAVALCLSMTACTPPADQGEGGVTTTSTVDSTATTTVSENKMMTTTTKALPTTSGKADVTTSSASSKRPTTTSERQHVTTAHETKASEAAKNTTVASTSKTETSVITSTKASTTVRTTSVATTTKTTTAKRTTTTTKAVVTSTKPITTTTKTTTTTKVTTTTQRQPTVSNTPEDVAQEVFRLINVEREKAGVAPLVYHYDAQLAANIRAGEISVEFSHTRPDGRDCFSVDDDADAPGYIGGENIALGHGSAERVMTSWMNSDGHRANILREGFDAVVIGYDPETYAWVQLFYYI